MTAKRRVRINVDAYTRWLAETHNTTRAVFLPTGRQRNRYEFLHSYSVSGDPPPSHVWMCRIQQAKRGGLAIDIPYHVLTFVEAG